MRFSNKFLLLRAVFIIHSTIVWLILYTELPLHTGKGKRGISYIKTVYMH
jgi:hypothetical protein